MTDRGTLIAGAGIVLACLIAGVGFLFIRADEAARARTEEALQAEAMQRQADAVAQRFDVNRKMDQQLTAARQPIEALAVGTSDLVNRQSPDGAWRSDTYATFKSGTALTPLAVIALQRVLKPSGDGPSPIHGGCDFLAKLVKADGIIEGADGEIDYPVYTAALTVVALSHPSQAKHVKARDAWLRFLLDRQLTEANGWQPADKPFGGWGYCRLVPKKPAPGTIAPPLVESNLSATVFALEALKAAGVKDRAPFEKALTFVRRCQNFLPRDGGVMLPEAYDDGGFTFIYDDAVRNKAGAILPRASSRDAFNSYGSATADGLRALRLCGETDTDRIDAARRWTQKNFRAVQHPGNYAAGTEANRDAVYFYYAASVARTLRDEELPIEWADPLAKEVARRQKPQGYWENPLELVRENEPIVATANALLALEACFGK